MSRVVFLIALMAATAAAQTVANPPPICFAFNDTLTVGSSGSVWVDPAGGVLTIHFTPPTSSVIERVDMPGGGYLGPCWMPGGGGFALYATSALGGPTVGPPLTTFSGVATAADPPTGSPTWLRASGLIQQGLEPLASTTVPPTGTPVFVFPIPLQPGLAGTTIGIQGLIVSQWGSIPIGGGATAEITNLVSLTLGY